MRPLPVMLVLVAACAPQPPDPEIHQRITPAVGEVLHPSDVYVRWAQPEQQLVVFERLDGPELARLPTTAGARAPLRLGGRPCELESHGPHTELETVSRRPTDDTVRQASPVERTRTVALVPVTLRCADGPAPGIVGPASVRARDVLPWLPLALVAGLLTGVLSALGDARSRVALQLAGVGLGLAALVGAFVVGWRHLDGGLSLTVPLLATFIGLCGAAAPLLFVSDGSTRTRAGAVGLVVACASGPVFVALIWPVWAAAAPLGALLLSLVVAVAVLGVAVK